MNQKLLQEKKDKILDKIFITSSEQIKILEKENMLLKKNAKNRTQRIMQAINSIMQDYEWEFKEKIGHDGSEETRDYALGLRDRISGSLYGKMFPDLKEELRKQEKKLENIGREHQIAVEEQKKVVENLKKLKKKKRAEMRNVSQTLRQIKS